MGGKSQRRAATAQAVRAEQFQERMSSTAHQREVRDLRAAGLNPILSATGGRGASSPSGAMAPMQDILTPAVSSALAARRLTQEIKNLEAVEQKTQADTDLTRATIPLRGSQADITAPAANVGRWLSTISDAANSGVMNRAAVNAWSRLKNVIGEQLGKFRAGTSAVDTIRERGRVGIRRPDGSIVWSDRND